MNDNEPTESHTHLVPQLLPIKCASIFDKRERRDYLSKKENQLTY